MPKMTDAESGSKQTKKPTRSAWQIIQTYFNVLNHALIFPAAVYITFFCYNAGIDRLISWHVWLCALGVSECIFNLSIYFKRN